MRHEKVLPLLVWVVLNVCFLKLVLRFVMYLVLEFNKGT